MSFRRDQELLLALLAAQMGFVEPHELRKILEMWKENAEQGVMELLRQQPGLSEEQLELLDALAEKQLEQHAGQLEASLQALSLSSQVEETLQLTDLASLNLPATAPSDKISPTTSDTLKRGLGGQAAHATQGRQSSRFTIVRPHAKGGLGEVFVALDHELNRHVALKEIQGKFAYSEASRNRFCVEAEITGGLEHPGIVPVYGLGTYDDGRPFYAMRFIKGQSLAEAATQFHQQRPKLKTSDFRSSTFRDLLRRFIDVCNSIEYAHSRGVLHRDLKPGNIMLGKYGETLVVDWGLAKTTDQRLVTDETTDEETFRLSSGTDPSHTAMGQIIGTLAYMSPEAAGGQIDAIGVTSDVYCLGATLYFLLTGVAPHQGSSTEVFLDVRNGKFTPPREFQSAIPKALESVCVKAMQSKPEERYSSASLLARDIEAWLADEPVSARRDPITVRLVRLARKNKEVFAASIAFGLLLLVGAMLSSLVFARKNRDLEIAYGIAEQNLRTAEEQRALAEKNAVTARGIALNITEIAERQLSEMNGQAAYRESLMDRAYDLFHQSLQQSPNEAGVVWDLARIARMTANVKVLLKKYAEAEALIAESIEMQQQLGRQDKESLAYLAYSYRDQGSIGKSEGNLQLAATAYEAASQLLHKAGYQFGEDAELRFLQGTLDIEQIGLAIEMVDYGKALECATRAEKLFLERIANGRPEDINYVLANMAAYRRGQALFQLDQPEQGRQVYQSAIDRGKQWMERVSTVNLRQVQARLHLYFADDLSQQAQLADDAVQIADEALRLYQILFDAKQDATYRYYLARAQQTRAVVATKMDDNAAAKAGLESALQNLRLVIEDSPTANNYAALADVLRSNAQYYAKSEDQEMARTLIEEAVASQRSAVDRSPTSLEARQSLLELEKELLSLQP